MGPFYELVCQETDQNLDQALFADLKAKNEARLAEIENEIQDAEQNLGRNIIYFVVFDV